MSDKKRKSEKQKSFKKRRKQTHKPLQDYTGIRGILFTCPAQREREAKTEALNLVQEYADEELQPEIQNQEIVDQSKKLEEEIQKMKTEKHFEVLDTQCKGNIFVRFHKDTISPNEVVMKIMQDFIDNPNQIKTRFLYKMIPVQQTCYASIENIKATAENLIPKFFEKYSGTTIKKWMLSYESKYSSGLKRTDVMDVIVKLVRHYHVVDLHSPQVVIFVVVIKNVCCIGIIDDYTKMYQYNISRFRKEQSKKVQESSTNQTEAVSELKKQPEKTKPLKKKDTQKKPKGPTIGGIKLF